MYPSRLFVENEQPLVRRRHHRAASVCGLGAPGPSLTAGATGAPASGAVSARGVTAPDAPVRVGEAFEDEPGDRVAPAAYLAARVKALYSSVGVGQQSSSPSRRRSLTCCAAEGA